VEVKKSRSYRDLDVWKLAIDLVKEVYKLTSNFPTSENFGLTNQIRRAAVSIPSNIAEGQGRNSAKEFRQFLAVGLGGGVRNPINYFPNNRIHISRRIKSIIKYLGQNQKDDQESC
jgi:hypothetical protein